LSKILNTWQPKTSCCALNSEDMLSIIELVVHLDIDNDKECMQWIIKQLIFKVKHFNCKNETYSNWPRYIGAQIQIEQVNEEQHQWEWSH
jgi:predicted RNase H-related nuclease YkuK (DUF458 family)